MTQEEKQLLVKDLCARLPYGHIKCKWIVESFNPDTFDEELEINEAIIAFIEPNKNDVYLYGKSVPVDIGEVKPYLRPMSSMTEEEKIELCITSYAPDEMRTLDEKLYVIQTNATNSTDWLNAHHFDYRGLIEKGLALEAPKGMYKIE